MAATRVLRVLRPWIAAGARPAGPLDAPFAALGGRGLSSATAPSLAGLKFTDKHEWVRMDGGIGTIGISHYAQDALGEVVFAQLPEPGTQLVALDECGALESVKAASELFCPVSGTVVDKNKLVEDKPQLINSSCYFEGWLFKVQLSTPTELEALMDENEYKKYLKSHEE